MAIGIAWAIIRPFITMVVLSIIFGKLGKLPSGGVPYPILVYAAMLPWQFFANALQKSSASFVANSNILTKVYFPRIIIPFSSIMVSLIDTLISFIILFVLMIYYKFIPSILVLTIPLFFIIAFLLSLGLGLWFGSLNVRFRDFNVIVPYLIQIGLYISPVGFNSNIIPEKYKLLYSLNPMVGIIDGFRWAIFGKNEFFNIYGFIFSIIFTLLILLSGLWFFRKMERGFADII